MTMHAIETEGLARTFGRLDAVHGLDLRVPAGSIFALIGPNAAGKTTTIKLLMNLVRPTGGRASVLGTPSTALGVREWQRIGYVSENQQLPDWMTTAQYLAYCRPLYPDWDDELCARLQGSLGLPMRGAGHCRLSRRLRHQRHATEGGGRSAASIRGSNSGRLISHRA
jgi:ABC-2 type transport system ATP-binding protein